jgi:hypothetical protein
VAAHDRALKAEEEVEGVQRASNERVTRLREQHEVKLKKALLDKDKASRRWMEIRFTKKRVNTVSAPTLSSPKFAVRRCSTTFSELFQAAVKGETVKSWKFEFKGRAVPVTDFGKTLTEVSGMPLRARLGGHFG